MKAYYFDDLPGDQRLPHDCIPSQPVTAAHLESLQLKYWLIPVEGHESMIDEISHSREYKHRDVLHLSKEKLPNYDELLEILFREHMHEDEEIRYVLSGAGYFDIRETPSDKWIRLAVGAGDLLVLPAGIYHRFTLGEDNEAKAIRLFKDNPQWAALYRSPETDANPHRVAYLRSLSIKV